MSENPTFQIGLTMAGAISAGAYTAGVVDYLIETLDRREKEKGKADIPNHQVEIPVITGASAGGMTAVMIAKALSTAHTPINMNSSEEDKKRNVLYDLWVNITEKPGSTMLDQLLRTDDVYKFPPAPFTEKLRSLLNSDFIKTLAEQAVRPVEQPLANKQAYVPDDLQLVMTLTNLRGFKLEEEFNPADPVGNKNKKTVYRVTKHSDYAHFVLDRDEYKKDGKIPVSFKQTNSRKINELDTLKQSAMATGAFPFGLRYRTVSRKPEYVIDNPYINTENTPDFVPTDKAYEALMIDGGTINNEPYKMAIRLLNDRNKKSDEIRCPPDSSNLPLKNAAILMIDPFPSEENDNHTYIKDPGLIGIFGSIISAMRNHLLYNSTKGGVKGPQQQGGSPLFMVSPKRKVVSSTGQAHFIDGDKAIACGSLIGFGGLLEKEFRVHDFYLGRRNCQRFLQQQFVVEFPDSDVDETNNFKPVLDGYKNPEALNRFMFERNGKKYVPIIPDTNVTNDNKPLNENEQYPWPVIDFCDKIYSKHKDVKNRAKWVIKAAAGSGILAPLVVNFLFTFIGNSLANKSLEYIKLQLQEWKLLKE